MLNTIATWAIIATPIIIGAGFYFAYRQCQSMRNARIAQLVIDLMSVWDSPEMSESRRKVNESSKNLQKDYEAADQANQIEAYSSLIRVANFFDELGVLVAEGLLDIGIAYDVFGKAEKTYYGIYEPMITTKKYEGYVQYFIKLNDLFVKEEARRSVTKIKKRRAS